MANEIRTTLTFLGTSTAIPDAGGDSPTFVINNKYLVDTGWTSVHNLRIRGIEPLDLEYVIFTHFHHDHYLSLPSLLFYLLMRGKPLKEVKIVGPVDDLLSIVRRAMNFLQAERYYREDNFPTLIPLAPGEGYEEERFKIDTCPTKHPVPGLCYRFKDKITGADFSFTGDTAYYQPIVEHVKGSSVLIHEAALGPVAADTAHNDYLHSGAVDAAKAALEAEVDKLIMLHMAEDKAASCVEAAKRIFPRDVAVPKNGETLEL